MGYGDGQDRHALTYQPLIDALEQHGGDSEQFADALDQFEKESEASFGHKPYTGGARDLKVVEVDGQFRIDEYDGSESLVTPYSGLWHNTEEF